MNASHPMIAWTIYDHPADYPDSVIARQWVIGAGGLVAAAVIVGPSIEKVRAMIPPGFERFPRDVDDEPQIVETWM